MSNRVVIVGPSSSGKSTVGALVASELGVPLISMDAFRAKNNRVHPFVMVGGKKIRNYECPTAWDANALGCKLRALLQAGAGFVAEGNHILVYPEILRMTERWAHFFYIDLPFTECLKRRKTRNRGTAPDWSFALIGEEQTRLIVEPQKKIAGITILDGSLRPTEIAARILGSIA